MSVAENVRPDSVPVPQREAKEDMGFRPWHFFVLASLISATVAVILSRRATPEHLVLMSLTIGAAGLAAAALYRMLAPLTAADANLFSERLSERTRAAIDREKALVLRSLKELELDRAMGKVSPRDFDDMAGRLRVRALSLMKQLDDERAGYRVLIERELNARLTRRSSEPVSRTATAEPSQGDRVVEMPDVKACASCGTSNDDDALFCKRCGGRLR